MNKAIDLWAAMPAVMAYDQRRRRGQHIVEPRNDLGYSANFLWMAFGEEPADEAAEGDETYHDPRTPPSQMPMIFHYNRYCEMEVRRNVHILTGLASPGQRRARRCCGSQGP